MLGKEKKIKIDYTIKNEIPFWQRDFSGYDKPTPTPKCWNDECFLNKFKKKDFNLTRQSIISQTEN